MKFHVGEIAINIGPVTNSVYVGRIHVGDEVEVIRVGPFSPGVELSGPGVTGSREGVYVVADYECRHPSGFHYFCCERHLRKRPQPGIPESVMAVFRERQPA